MDKIKTVKIKNEDGSVSEETYTISVDARNVDMDNGKDLQDTIGTINVDIDGNISRQLKYLNENVNNLNIDIKKKAYFFNTIADMKNADLKIGDYVCTLGYYIANDGGAGEYQIISGNYIDDGGIYHQLNNNLFAKLIANEEINVKQFGAYGDKNHDDTEAIQKAFTYSKSILLTSSTNPIITFEEGTYLVSNTLNLALGVRLYLKGTVVILSSVDNGVTLWLNSADILYTAGQMLYEKKQRPLKLGSLIDGPGVLSFNKTNNYADVPYTSNNNSIAIQIGSNSHLDNISTISLTEISNINVYGFKIGIYITGVDTYINKFNNCSVLFCDTDILYGCANGYNSGENMTFERCIFANSYTAFKTQGVIDLGVSFNFNNCSFDYNAGNFFIEGTNNYIISLNCFNCHTEGVGETSTFTPYNSLQENYDYILFVKDVTNRRNVIMKWIGGYFTVGANSSGFIFGSNTQVLDTQTLANARPIKILLHTEARISSAYGAKIPIMGDSTCDIDYDYVQQYSENVSIPCVVDKLFAIKSLVISSSDITYYLTSPTNLNSLIQAGITPSWDFVSGDFITYKATGGLIQPYHYLLIHSTSTNTVTLHFKADAKKFLYGGFMIDSNNNISSVTSTIKFYNKDNDLLITSYSNTTTYANLNNYDNYKGMTYNMETPYSSDYAIFSITFNLNQATATDINLRGILGYYK